MKRIGEWIDQVVLSAKGEVLRNYKNIGSKDRERDQEARKRFRQEMKEEKKLRQMAEEVRKLCRKFTVPEATPF